MSIFFSIIFASLLVGRECRSFSSNLNEAVPGEIEISDESQREFSTSNSVDDSMKNFTNVDEEFIDSDEIRRFVANQGLKLEKILSDFASRTADFKDYEERSAQWLKLLRRMLQSISRGNKNFEKSSTSDTRFNDVGGFEAIMIDGDKKKLSLSEYNWLEDLVEYLNEQDIEGQSSDENEKHVKSRYENSSALFSLLDETAFSDTKDDDIKNVEELDRMLVGVRNEIDRIRKYFEKLCSKHHAWRVEGNNDVRSIDGFYRKKI